ncbi:protein SGT1 homolog [Anthonomus grandis grandis]|uniref:protein SGT1 homolog n=1 Tax=Anthonomus grandis grandis TaxID=2921223 RepID=UPI00216527E1|nr:protein SGT1 homolog [Anthonomus grandis grandis]
MEAMDLDAMAESLQAIIEGVPSAAQPNPTQPNSSQPNPSPPNPSQPNPPNPTQSTEASQPTESSSQRNKENNKNANNRGRNWRARSGRVHRRRERVNLHQQKTLLSAVTDAVASAILRHTSKGGYRGHFRGRGKN